MVPSPLSGLGLKVHWEGGSAFKPHCGRNVHVVLCRLSRFTFLPSAFAYKQGNTFEIPSGQSETLESGTE